MAAVHLLRFGETSRTVTHVPATVQASATWEVHDLTETVSSSAYVAAAGAATIDSLALATSAAAGPATANGRRITMTSTAGVTVGRWYMMTATGKTELVEVEGVSTSAYVDLVHPLAGSYETGAVLRGVTMTASLPDAIAASRDHLDRDEPLRIVWTYASGEIHQQQLRVVRQDHGDYDKAGILGDVRRLFPDVSTRTEHKGKDTLGELVDTIYRQHRAEILSDGDKPERVLHGEQGQWVMVWSTLEHLAAQGNAPEQQDPTLWLDHCQRQVKRFWGSTRRGLAGERTAAVAPVVEAATGTQDTAQRQRLSWS
jgi:hypothetical protein